MAGKKVKILLVNNEKNTIKGHIIMDLFSSINSLIENEIYFWLYCSKETLDQLLREINSFGKNKISKEIINSWVEATENFELELHKIVMNQNKISKQSSIEETIVFIPWWHFLDLTELIKLDNEMVERNISWSTIVHVSPAIRSNKKCRERDFLNQCVKLSSLKTLFYWDTKEEDSFPVEINKKIKRLPEFHYQDSKTVLEKVMLTVAFLGQQSAKRGIVTLAVLILLNPNVTFILQGNNQKKKCYFPRIRHRAPCGKFLDGALSRAVQQILNKARNIEYVDEYFEDPKHLNDLIRRVSAVFVAGHTSYYSSGIALQSVANGTYVIWTDGNSAHADQMRIASSVGKLRKFEKFVPFSLARKLKLIQNLEPPVELYSWNDFSKTFSKNI
jgi:hypothetical protein